MTADKAFNLDNPAVFPWLQRLAKGETVPVTWTESGLRMVGNYTKPCDGIDRKLADQSPLRRQKLDASKITGNRAPKASRKTRGIKRNQKGRL